MKKKSKETHLGSSSLRKISPAELKKILRSHEEWVVSGNTKGQRADLAKADLRDADLGGAFLRDANLRGADISFANLIDSDLSNADLVGSFLVNAELSNAYLGDADISRANLTDAKLDEVRLINTNLSMSNLTGANFFEAFIISSNCSGAKFDGAELSWANINESNLSYTTLRGASLEFTNLNNTQLSYANIEGAYFVETVFTNTDLTGIAGLDTCMFAGPCTIDHRTLLMSKNLPESFLRGCGLPDSLIDYLPYLLNKPIQFYSCFISYSHKDEKFAQRLYADLQREGVRCWYAPEDLKIGEKTRHSIDDAIRVHDKLLLVLSENSVKSNWVEHEVETALAKEDKNKNTVLFPVRLDDKVMDTDAGWASHVKNTRHIGDFKKWKDHDSYQTAFKRLVRDLKKVLEKK